MNKLNWIEQHKRLVLEYTKLKNQKKELGKRMVIISKKLNQMDIDLLNEK